MATPTIRPRLAALAPLAAAALLAPAAAAGDPDLYPVDVLVIEGQVVAGVGAVTSIGNLAVTNGGDWIVEVDTDNANTDTDGALLTAAGLLVQEGAALAEPAGASLDFFDSVVRNDGGRGGYNHSLDGTSGSNDDTAVYLDDDLLVQEGQLSNAAGLSLGTPYIGFFDVKVNDSDDLLVMASVDDPAISSTVDRVLVILQEDGAGNLTSETVVAKEGDVLPGQSEQVADFETGPHNVAFNDAGQVLFIADLTGDTATDHALYRDATLLAQEGRPSPVPLRAWSSLSLAEVDLNNSGGWVVSGSLDGDAATNALIAVNGAKLVQEGDTVQPGATPWQLTSFGSGPVHLADNGTVLWYGVWDDPDTTRNKGLFLNDRLVVQEGVTQVAGSTVDTLRGIQDGYDLSDDGQWMAFEAVLADGREGVFRIFVGPWTSLGSSLAGTGGVSPDLAGLGSLSPGALNSLEISDAAPSALMIVVVGNTAANVPFFLGNLVPTPTVIRYFFTNASGELTLPFVLPVIPPGFDLYVQGWIDDPGAVAGVSGTNAVLGVVQP